MQRLLLPIFVLIISQNISYSLANEAPVSQNTLEIIQDFIATQRLPGVIFSETTQKKSEHIFDGRKNILKKDEIQKDELFPIASLSKIFTSILILQEVEAEKISLDTKVKDIFRSDSHEKYENLKVKDIMYHHGGFPVMDEDINPHDFQKYSKSRKSLSEYFLIHGPYYPLNKSHYSTYGYVVLGAILEQIENKSWEEIVTEKLLNPLHLDSCRFAFDSTLYPKKPHLKLPILLEKDYESLLSGHYKLHRKVDWMPVSIKERAHPPLDNPGAGLFCKTNDIHKFVHAQLEGYRFYLDNPFEENNLPTQKIFKKISTYKNLFHSPEQNMQSISHWVLFSQQIAPQKVSTACAYGSSGGTAVVTCFDLNQNKVVSAFANAWSEKVFTDLQTILNTALKNKLFLRPLNPSLLPRVNSFMNSASKFTSNRN